MTVSNGLAWLTTERNEVYDALQRLQLIVNLYVNPILFFNYVVGHNLTQTTQVSKLGSHVSEKDQMSNRSHNSYGCKIGLGKGSKKK